jgi:hypothetical protein
MSLRPSMRLVIGLAVLGLVTLALAVMAIIPLPPPFGNAPNGCAGWYIVQYLKEHGMWPPKAPIMLPMICWATIPPSTPGGLIPLPPPPPYPPHPIPLKSIGLIVTAPPQPPGGCNSLYCWANQ